MKGTEKVYALKILNKWEMLKRHQVSASLIPKPHSALVSFPNHIQHYSHSQTVGVVLILTLKPVLSVEMSLLKCEPVYIATLLAT